MHWDLVIRLSSMPSRMLGVKEGGAPMMLPSPWPAHAGQGYPYQGGWPQSAMQMRPPLYGWGADPAGFNQVGPTAGVHDAPGLGMVMPSLVQPAIAVAAASFDATAAAFAPPVCVADAGGCAGDATLAMAG